MQATTTVKTDIGKRTVHFTMSGIYDEVAMRDSCEKMKAATASFREQAHMYIADMRGMKPTHPTVANLLGQAIGWSRQHGVVLCAHISDDTVQRLQMQRVTRNATKGDEQTVEVDTLDEAQRVLAECRDKLLAGVRLPTATNLAAAGAHR